MGIDLTIPMVKKNAMKLFELTTFHKQDKYSYLSFAGDCVAGGLQSFQQPDQQDVSR